MEYTASSISDSKTIDDDQQNMTIIADADPSFDTQSTQSILKEEKWMNIKKRRDNHWELLKSCNFEEMKSTSFGYKWFYKERAKSKYRKIVVKR